jgi:hypothetical protein
MGNSAKIRHRRHRRQFAHCAIEAVVHGVDDEVVTLRSAALSGQTSELSAPRKMSGSERRRQMREQRRLRRKNPEVPDEQLS